MRLIFLGFLFLTIFSFGDIYGQITINGEERYGNEWIDYSQPYFVVTVEEDGLYRIGKSALESAGFSIGTIPMSNFQMFWMGEEIAIYTTTSDLMGDSDFVEFYGKKIGGELDQYLFQDAKSEMLNPMASLHAEKSSYYLVGNESISTVRIEVLDNNLEGELPLPQEWYWHEEKNEPKSNWVKAQLFTQGVSFSTFDQGEGFGTNIKNSVHVLDIPTSSIAQIEETARLKVRVAGNQTRAIHELSIQWNGSEIGLDTFTNSEINESQISVSLNDLIGQNELRTASIGVGGIKDRHSIGFASLTYPRLFDASDNNEFFFQITDQQGPILLEITNINATPNAPIFLHNLTTHERLEGSVNDGRVRFHINTAEVNGEYLLTNAVKDISAEEIIERHFKDLRTSQTSFLIISHPNLYQAYNGSNQVQEYANYRSSDAGGGYNVSIIDIGELTDQFAYGVEGHPFAIKNFVNYTEGRWSNLEYVLLLGKGINYDKVRFSSQSTVDELALIPTYGTPGSDNILMSKGRDVTPIYPVGRISAYTPQHVADYLDKLMTMEDQLANAPQTIEDRLWMKRGVHLAGGDIVNNSDGERVNILNRMNSWKRIFEEGELGGEITTLAQNSSALTDELLENNLIKKMIDEGIILKSYFGHGAESATQYNDLEDPVRLDNAGRYPFMSALGCKTGNCFITESNSYGERNILEQEKGGIVYIATSGFGYINNIGVYAPRWYDYLDGGITSTSAGEAFQLAIEATKDINLGISRTLNEQLIFQGDPAIIPYQMPGPDYITDYRSIKLNPSVINIDQTNNNISFTIYNLGSVVEDSLEIKVSQKLPDNSIVDVKLIKIKSPTFSSEVIIQLNSLGKNSLGLNTLFISLDPNRKINELPEPEAENNNNLIGPLGQDGYEFFIIDGGIKPIYPQEFGIIGKPSPILNCSTNDPLAPSQSYIFEIDTTELFNSPIKERIITEQIGGLVKWEPSLILVPETVYYWRVSTDSVDAQKGYSWVNRSFTYLPDINSGWNQGDYFQYLKNQLTDIHIDQNRQLQYLPEEVFEFTYLSNIEHFNDRSAVARSGNFLRAMNPTQNLGSLLCVYAAHPQLRVIGKDDVGDFGAIPFLTNSFLYKMNKIEDRKNVKELLDAIPQNSQVHIYTVIQDTAAFFDIDNWENDRLELGYTLFDILEAYGANKVRLLSNTGVVPYVFIFNKGEGPIFEDIAPTINSTLRAISSIPFLSGNGSFRTEIIGPSLLWSKVQWNLKDYDLIGDVTSLKIYGIDNQQNQVLLNEIFHPDTILDIDYIDAGKYPFLRLEYNSQDQDDTLRTPAQIDYMRVLYTSNPELLINPAGHFSFYKDTLDQGEELLLTYEIKFLGPSQVDSVEIRYSVQNTREIYTSDKTIYIKSGNTRVNDSIRYNTSQLRGDYEISTRLNSENSPLEVERINNILTKPFYVKPDIINPLIDVTFDGLHIINGEIISSHPKIVIQLTDYESAILLEDTSLLNIHFIRQSDEFVIPAYFSLDWASFIPPSSVNNNVAQIILAPSFETDDIYQLVVSAMDQAGNSAGVISYQTSFEIRTTKAISNFINYPNPFSSKTQFVYTLTGDSPPENFSIQILTISGKIVREITKDEIGELAIGNHMTDYAWDGADEYGDLLANGVYLFRLNLSEDTDFEKIELPFDKFTKNDFGKMMILR